MLSFWLFTKAFGGVILALENFTKAFGGVILALENIDNHCSFVILLHSIICASQLPDIAIPCKKNSSSIAYWKEKSL